jgi:starvation-inducible DNA-binding protein
MTQPLHPEAPAINIGISDEARNRIAGGLSRLLADSYSLYLKTHYYHWNVTGPRFRDLHLLFEEQYTELATAVDEIAERVRTLGYQAPGTYAAFAKLTQIDEDTDVPDAETMLRNLVTAQETLVRTAREVLPSAQEADDESSASLIADRMVVHEKAAWMLRSLV